MKIGKIKLNLPLILAPMAGVTDYPFRLLCKEQGAALVFSEFVSADGIIRGNAKTLKMIKFTEFERPIGIQIFGDSPEVMAQAAKMVGNKFSPDIIDINYGCPVPKITRKVAGSAALKDLCLIQFKNYEEAQLNFSSNINCFVGDRKYHTDQQFLLY